MSLDPSPKQRLEAALRTVEALQAKLDTSELQRKDDGERHSANYDAIVEACGAPDWEYPGQVVRDVRRLRRERDEARAAIAPVVTRGVCATCGLSPVLATDGSVGAHFDATYSGQAPCWGAGRPPRSTFASGDAS